MLKISKRSVVLGLLGAALPVGLSACGGSSSPTVASLGATTTTTAAPAAGSAAPGRRQPEKFSQCMRAHGVTNFPDPVIHGNAVSIRIDPSISGSPHFASAQKACKYLLPGLAKAGPGHVTPQQQEDYLKASACMRAHGVTNFPDFTFPNGNVNLEMPPTIDENSSQFNQARQICQKLVPSGMPYSGQ